MRLEVLRKRTVYCYTVGFTLYIRSEIKNLIFTWFIYRKNIKILSKRNEQILINNIFLFNLSKIKSMNLLHMKEQILKTKFINNKIKKFNTPVRSTSRAWMHKGFEGGAEISLKLIEFDKKRVFFKKKSV